MEFNERSQIGRLGAWALHATHDPKVTTAAARAAFLNRFELQADPDGILSVDERTRRAAYARKLYFGRLALRSAQVRKKKAQK